MTKRIKRVLLAGAVVGQIGKLQKCIELVDLRDDLASIWHSEQPVIGLHVTSTLEHAIEYRLNIDVRNYDACSGFSSNVKLDRCAIFGIFDLVGYREREDCSLFLF